MAKLTKRQKNLKAIKEKYPNPLTAEEAFKVLKDEKPSNSIPRSKCTSDWESTQS